MNDNPRRSRRPVVVVSRCLVGGHCRYNGEIIDDPFVRRMREFVDFRPVCPETEIGLGVPRDPVRVVRKGRKTCLIQPASGRDLTEQMRAFCRQFLSGPGRVDGFLLKARSPSCGVRDTKIYDERGRLLSARGSGFFGQAVVRRFGRARVEDDARMQNPRARERFLALLQTGRGSRSLGWG